jgi:endonuclease/exonuclease/phosphatase family metal-dependent hydrolase
MIRMATWNIGGGYVSTDGHLSYGCQDIAYFADVLREISPDIVCLQEAHISAQMDQPAWLAKTLGLHVVSHVYEDSHLHPQCQLAMAVLSRIRPEDSTFVMLPNPRLKLVWRGEEVISHDKGFLIARLEMDGRSFHVVSGHLLPFHRFGLRLEDSAFGTMRARLATLLLEDMPGSLVGADMNCADLSLGLAELFASYRGVPFDSTRPDGRVTDHILYPASWELVRGWVLPTRADHHLCVADLD